MSNKSLLTKFSNRYSVEPGKMLETLKNVAFKQKNGTVTNEQMIALLLVADQYKLNPFTKEIYAYPDKGQIVPVVGVDGWSRIINSHEQFDGMDFEYSENIMTMDGGKPCHEWVECKIHRKDRQHPVVVREYLDEVYRKANYVGPWQTHTKRMLRHKATIQCARLAFGFVGIFEEDEATRIIEAQAVEVQTKASPEQTQKFQSLLMKEDKIGMLDFMSSLEDRIQTDLYNSFPAGEKVKGKQAVSGLISSANEYLTTVVDQLTECYEKGDLSGGMEVIEEMTDLEKSFAYPRMSPEVREFAHKVEEAL